MKAVNKTNITVESTVNTPVTKVWEFWNEPKHIIEWYHASEDWHAPFAENDLQTNGKFKTTMAAKDGSYLFDFEGVYTNVQQHELIAYTLLDGRKVRIDFSSQGNSTKVVETFEAEETNPIEMQKNGWQAILDNFKEYAESNQ